MRKNRDTWSPAVVCQCLPQGLLSNNCQYIPIFGLWNSNVFASLILKFIILLQEKLANQMRSLWEKIQETERNLKKNCRGTDPWMVSRRTYFSEKSRLRQTVRNLSLIMWAEITMYSEIQRVSWTPSEKNLLTTIQPTFSCLSSSLESSGSITKTKDPLEESSKVEVYGVMRVII